MTIPDQFKSAQQQHQKLAQQLHHHNYLYHTLDQPEITDAKYDQLMQQLLEIEDRYPELITPESPSQLVGSKPLSRFTQVKHLTPMLSIKNIKNELDLVNFLKTIEKTIIELHNAVDTLKIVAEPKIDGLSCSLRYEKRKLILAATRGDGLIGEDVTENIRAVTDIPQHLPNNAPDHIEIRGEIYISDHDFIEINKTQESLGNKKFSNPRNAAAGYLKQLDLNTTENQPLKFFGYAFGEIDTQLANTQIDIRKKLLAWGFKLVKPAKLLCGVKEIMAFFQKTEKQRSTLGYSIDGIVYKVNDLSLQQRLGFKGKYPKWARAHKFPALRAHTHIKEIIISVGRLGALTPVANLEPVNVGGAWVSRATLHNEDEIKRKDFRVGDLVIIQRAGDVIPQVVSVELTDRPKNSSPFQYPTKCPSCGGPIERNDSEAAWTCNAGIACPAQALERLKFFVSRKAFYIKALGDKNIEQFYSEGLIKIPADIYKLEEKLAPKTLYNHNNSEITPLQDRNGWGETSAKKLFAAIRDKRTITLNKFIFSLGINAVGETLSKKLAKKFKTFENMQTSINKAISGDKEERKSIQEDVCGEVATNNLLNFFKNESDLSSLNQLLQEITIEPEDDEASKDKPLYGKTVVFTGKLTTMTREEAKTRAESLGAIIGNSITQKTDIVVAGEAAGSKLKKAEKYGKKITSESEWKEIIDGK
ncbi:MAG: DNA ligase (NAD(+)) LigA [Chloroflexi bacterium]|nr:MAG: DNA ligase (NAD(+)) LigA [Chloroflexota bacterium]